MCEYTIRSSLSVSRVMVNGQLTPFTQRLYPKIKQTRWRLRKAPTCSSAAVWGSASCSRTLQRAAERIRGIEPEALQRGTENLRAVKNNKALPLPTHMTTSRSMDLRETGFSISLFVSVQMLSLCQL